MNILAPHPYVKKLERVLDRMGGVYTTQDILTAVRANKMQMFSEGDSIAVTQIVQYPRAKVLDILIVIGNLEQARKLHDRVLAFATEIGASIVQAYGRFGWIEDAKKRGWEIKARNFVYQRTM